MKKFYKYVFLLLAAAAILFFHNQKFSGVKGIKITTDYPPDTLVVNFLDIGQGDASYIRFPGGTDMLIDCSKDARILEALGRVMPVSDHVIDYLVPTHPDLDHYGGCVDVLNNFDVKNVIYTGYKKDNSGTFNSFKKAVDSEAGSTYHEIKAPETLTIASTTLEFLYPDHDVSTDPEIPDGKNDKKQEESNNTSQVIKMTYGQNSLLFTGDMPTPLEDYLVEKYGDKLDVDILKVGHHGSSGSSGEEFLKIVSPEDAIISVGKENSYGHPSPRVLKRLERVQAKVFRTDELGDIIFHITTSSIFSPVI